MIGVIADSSNYAEIREFFELFKTPWEFYRTSGNYQVLICAGGSVPTSSAKLVLVYAGRRAAFDEQHEIEILSERSGATFCNYDRHRFPLYGDCLTFRGEQSPVILDEQTGELLVREIVVGERTIARVGFDLFHEVGVLLQTGQPVAHARIPTLELHIALLRQLILRHCVPLVEIPPIPATHDFIACLTHDVDHAGIRNHRFDHTMVGFLYRATIESVNSFCRGRKSLRQLAANLMAAFSLPFVYLGLVKDFWSRFDRYIDIEGGAPSTFFIIPKKLDTGEGVGKASWKRATKYDVKDVPAQLDRIGSAGGEIGLHGIDAWRDVEKAKDERRTVEDAVGTDVSGVRIHWLCFDENSPCTLEQGGFSYDSTIGYNETIGYRAGTTQVFKPFQVSRMLELPMHIMDTALFYSGYLNLSPNQARLEIKGLVDNACRFGGVLTINWHDRSIAPERLWNETYEELLNYLKSKRAWFATGGQAVSWFRKRRAAAINVLTDRDGTVRVGVSLDTKNDELPGLRLRVHEGPNKFIDTAFNNSTDLELQSSMTSSRA